MFQSTQCSLKHGSKHQAPQVRHSQSPNYFWMSIVLAKVTKSHTFDTLLVMPRRTGRSPSAQISGPPESPWHPSLPPSIYPAQNIASSTRNPEFFVLWHVSGLIIFKSTSCKASACRPESSIRPQPAAQHTVPSIGSFLSGRQAISATELSKQGSLLVLCGKIQT